MDAIDEQLEAFRSKHGAPTQPSKDMVLIARWLKTQRAKRNVTQEVLGSRMDPLLPATAIGHVENLRRPLSPRQALQCASIFKADDEWVLFFASESYAKLEEIFALYPRQARVAVRDILEKARREGTEPDSG